jgi:hypothetical protein
MAQNSGMETSRFQSLQFNAVLMLLLILIVITGLQASKAYQIPPAPTPFRWEYKVEKIPDDEFTNSMNKLGAEGWEAISARRATDSVTTTVPFYYEIIFRRPLLLQPGP